MHQDLRLLDRVDEPEGVLEDARPSDTNLELCLQVAGGSQAGADVLVLLAVVPRVGHGGAAEALQSRVLPLGRSCI